jgi:single-stranded DNA-binding protein
MSQQYDNTNSGILSKNDRKEKDTHPDHKGTLNVEGVEYWLSAWIKERKDGSGKFFSLSVKRKDGQSAPPSRSAAGAQQPNKPAVPSPSGFDDMDDDIPF